MNNQMMTQPQFPKFSDMLNTKGYRDMLSKSLREPARINRFVASITSAVAATPALQECDPSTVLSAALLGESLKLSPSPQLGRFYMVPFDNKKKGCKDAQFVLGYKGYIELALRSGQYKRLNVLSVKEGELVSWDPLTEEIVLDLIQDDADREVAPTIGYVAMFEYLNGFRKTIYWSRSKMEAHADKYSPAFSLKATGGKFPKVSFADYCAGNYPKGDAWKYSSFWYKDFDGMAYKTMIRQIISKWGIMSTEMQTAFENDHTSDGGEVIVEIDDPAPRLSQPEDDPATLGQDTEPQLDEQEEEQVNLNDL